MSGRFSRTSFVAGLVFVALGVLFLLDQLEVIRLDLAYLGPGLLIVLGLAVLLGGFRRRPAPSTPAGPRPAPSPPVSPRPTPSPPAPSPPAPSPPAPSPPAPSPPARPGPPAPGRPTPAEESSGGTTTDEERRPRPPAS